MADDSQRNFRSVYYEKVGFRGVEEKKSLEILLKDDRLDIEKLCTFSQRFPLPSMYRILVWKVLLGIIPPHHESHALVMKYRKEQYWDIHHALRVIRFINDCTPQVDVFLRIHLLESGKLPRNVAFPLEPEDEVFLAIAKAMEEMVEDPIECYWLVRCFVNQLNSKHKDSLQQLVTLYPVELYVSQIGHLKSIENVKSEEHLDVRLLPFRLHLWHSYAAHWMIDKTQFCFINGAEYSIFRKTPKVLEQYLNIEDNQLLMHLKACAAMSKLPYDLWFKKCFAGCLPESSLQRQLLWEHDESAHFLGSLVNVVVPGSAGTDKVLTVDHNVAQSFPITVTDGVVLTVTIAGNIKKKILQQTQLLPRPDFNSKVIFAAIICPGMLEPQMKQVWDKVISGSCKILVFVAVEILLTFKMKIIALNSAEKITQFLENIPQDNTDAIVSKAVDLWRTHCGTPAHSV